MGQEKKILTACQGWGCHENCVIEAVVVDGKLERTQRAILGGSEDSRICHKGVAMPGLPFIEGRPLKPLKRVGERGEGKFEEISWEQAMDEIGAKLKEIRERYGSKALLINPFMCGYVTGVNAVEFAMEYRFAHLFGASMLEYPAADFGGLVLTNVDYGDTKYSLGDPKTMRDAKHIIIWGGNPIGFTRAAATTKTFMDAQERGVKIVDIGVLFDTTAAKADQWIGIKAGTDAALALAMANYMIQEGLCDEEFITKHTVAPFLVREDNDKFLRESDISPAGNPLNYVYMDVSGVPLSIGPGVSDFAGNTPDLDAEVTVAGIACRSAYRRLKEHVSQYTLENQEEITGVPATTARQVIREYCETQPATMFIYFGMRYANAMHTCRAIALLATLSGNIKHPGGAPIVMGSNSGHPVMLNEGAIMFPQGPFNLQSQQVNMIDVLDSFEDSDSQQYKAFFNVMGNPVQNWPSRQLWRDKFMPNMELVVDFEIRMTDTSKFADYVLPEANILERHELVCPSHGCVCLLEPAVEPQGEVKTPAAIWYEIAKRVGLEEFFNPDTEEWLKLRLGGPDPAFASVTPAITWDRLKAEKSIRLNVPEKPYDPIGSLDYVTPSGKIEFYCEDLAEAGGAMAIFEKPRILRPELMKYPLHYFPGRHRFFMQGQFTEFPELRVLGGKKSTVALNPVTAKEYGLHQGDWVEVFNDGGNARAQLTLSESFPPGMAHLWYSYPADEYPTDPPTALSVEQNTRATQDPIPKRFAEVYIERGRAHGVPETLSLFRWGVAELFWDDLCDIRKAEVQ